MWPISIGNHVRWRGPGDFFIEVNLLRAETEVEVEGVCDTSERRAHD